MGKHPEMNREQQGAMAKTLEEVAEERVRQQAKWGEQNHKDGTGDPGSVQFATLAKFNCDAAAREDRLTYKHILEEEVCEAFAESDQDALYNELIQVAAVCVSWCEAIKRRQSK